MWLEACGAQIGEHFGDQMVLRFRALGDKTALLFNAFGGEIVLRLSGFGTTNMILQRAGSAFGAELVDAEVVQRCSAGNAEVQKV